MKSTAKFLTILLFATVAVPAFAKKWRVNNALPPNQVDFSELKDAVLIAEHGDTIYVEGSAQPYQGGIEINRKLTIIGPGYFLDQPNLVPTWCNQLPATIGGPVVGMTLGDGSNGSYVTGLNFFYGSTNPSIAIENTSNITIERNRLEGIRFNNGATNAQSNCSNIIIKRNIVRYDIWVGCNVTLNGVYIANNLILGDVNIPCSNANITHVLNGTILNNTMSNESEISVEGCEISYNYVGCIDDAPVNISIHHNIIGSNDSDCQGVIATNNTNIYDPYNDNSFNFDQDYWILLPVDSTTTHGAYNGPTPYYSNNPVSKANLPAWPVIYECNVQACGDTTIQVKFKVRTNN